MTRGHAKPCSFLLFYLPKKGSRLLEREERMIGMELADSPVIAAVRSPQEFEAALNAPVETVFLLNASLLTLRETVLRAHEKQKYVFVHIDLAEGVGKDSAGVAFLRKLGIDGVISTRGSMIRLAKECGLQTVQRFFTVDSHSIETAIESIRSVSPDCVELMPGVIPKILHRLCGRVSVPVIAGGLIETKEEIIAAINAGASAVSTGCAALWYE